MSSRQTPIYFTEKELPNGKGGIRISTLVTEVLHEETGSFGKIAVYDTPFYGRMLAIDDIIQTTISDEFIYHEMMVVLPSLYIPKTESVLIIGGGDGGAIKQALRLPDIQRIVQVEIDDHVVELSKKYLPEVSGGAYDDPKVELVIADGAQFLRETEEKFDLIVMDLTDPVPGSPAEALFTEGFYATAKRALREGGVISAQCGSLVFQAQEVKSVKESLGKSFANAVLHHAVVPGYQLSSFGFMIATDRPSPTTEEVSTRLRAVTGTSRFLTEDMYPATLALPPYMLESVYS